MQDADNIIFEYRDTEIFSIPDVRTKLNTLQNYFFPRLQRLLDMALLLIKEVYKIDPFEKYTFVYRPSHRKDAKNNIDLNEIYIGIAGRRDLHKQLKITRPDGKPYTFHPSYLCFKVLPTGEMYVELEPFKHYDSNYIRNIKTYLIRNYDTFSVLQNIGKFSFEDGDNFTSVIKRLNDNHIFWLSSSYHYFPIKNQAAIHNLNFIFLSLYPILDACYDLAEGKTPIFSSHLANLQKWLQKDEDQVLEHKPEKITPQLPDLDSYKFVRAGLWYQVLARDNWTCCSCKRSAKEHGIVLHVDHIKPRSHGGKDELTNLQTLCLKCNIGKSNKDDTDLRS
jgi:hypothetical protein